MRKCSILALAAAAMLVTTASGALAQNGRSTTDHGSTPNGRPFRALQTQIASIEQQLAALDAMQAQLDALAQQVAANTTSIEDLRDYDELLTQRIASLGGAVLALETALAEIADDVEALQLHDRLMDDWLAALEQRWRQAEARLADHAGDIQALIYADRALQEYAAALQQQINFVRSTANLAESLATSAQLRLSDLQALLATKQNLIRTACPPGSSIRQIDAAGNVACEFDDVGGGGAGRLVMNDSFGSTYTVPANGSVYGYAYCPSGYVSLSGGFSLQHPVQVFYSIPLVSLGWVVGATNPSGTARTLYVTARCAALSS